jgi:hypothetical protein
MRARLASCRPWGACRDCDDSITIRGEAVAAREVSATKTSWHLALGRSLVTGAVFLACGVPALAGETSLRISSDPRDFVGLGQKHFVTPNDGTFTVYTSPRDIQVSFSPFVGFASWHLYFAAPQGAVLTEGPHFDASGTPVRDAGQPALSVDGGSHGCPSRGGFLIKRLAFGAGGNLASFWVTFEQSCEGSFAVLRGELRYNVEVDMAVEAPLVLRVEKGLPVAFDVRATSSSGGAVSLAATGLPPGAVFENRGDGSGALRWRTSFTGIGDFDLTFSASNSTGAQDTTITRIAVIGITSLFLDGLTSWKQQPSTNLLLTPKEGDFYAFAYDSAGWVQLGFRSPDYLQIWTLNFATADGSPLVPGLYTDTTRDRQPGHPMFNLGGGGPGSFEVLEARFTPGGTVLAFHATFEQQYSDSTRTIRGEIRYLADVPFLLRAPAHAVAVEERDAGFPVEAFDAGGGTVVLSANPLPGGAEFADNGDGTGAFRWTPAHGQAGTYVVTFTATGDGGRQEVVPAVFNVGLRNDDFGDAVSVTSLPFRDDFEAAHATVSEDDPVCETISVSGNVWYALTLPTSTTVELSSFGSRTAVRIGAYRGTRGSLVKVTCDYDRIKLQAEAGVTYFILVWPLSEYPATISMSLPPPPPSNDDFDNAVLIGALPFEDEVRNDAATTAPDDPGCVESGKTIWYTWTAPEALWVEVNVTASEFVTSASVYTGSRGALTPVACTRGAPLRFLATRSTTYHFMFGAVEDIIGGHVILRIIGYPVYRLDLVVDHTVSATPRTGSWILGGTVTCSHPTSVGVTGTVRRPNRSAPASLNFAVWFECDGVTRWSATVGGADSPALPGRFEVSARVDGYEPVSGQSATGTDIAIVLVTGHRGATDRGAPRASRPAIVQPGGQ